MKRKTKISLSFFEFLLLYIIDWNPGRVSDKCKAVPLFAFCVYFLFCFACSSLESCHQKDGKWLVLCWIKKKTSDLKLLNFYKQYHIYLCLVVFFHLAYYLLLCSTLTCLSFNEEGNWSFAKKNVFLCRILLTWIKVMRYAIDCSMSVSVK